MSLKSKAIKEAGLHIYREQAGNRRLGIKRVLSVLLTSSLAWLVSKPATFSRRTWWREESWGSTWQEREGRVKVEMGDSKLL